MTRWVDLEDGRGVLELDEMLTPPGLALELEVEVACGRTWASWKLEGGAVLALVTAGKA